MPATETRKRTIEAVFLSSRHAEIRINGLLKNPLFARDTWTNERFENEVREVAHRYGDTVSIKR